MSGERQLLPATVRQVFDVLPGIADGTIARPLTGAMVNDRREIVLTFADGLVVNIGEMSIMDDGRTWKVIGQP